MALNIQAQDIIIDETTLLQKDDANLSVSHDSSSLRARCQPRAVAQLAGGSADIVTNFGR